ncbi:unnamed protein product [Lactuca saligna]|uniref:Uncharacterized protein n=1 Tax=Lactuca saligna TaxID=75948 RepID=A0AA36ECM9_LACSI|nr:unnamed protein product [Lactuca saligna]
MNWLFDLLCKCKLKVKCLSLKKSNNNYKIMDDKIAAFTIFTLFFFTVSAARFPVAPPATNHSAVEHASKLANTSCESLASADSNIRLPGEKAKSDSDESTAKNPLPEPEKTTTDLTQGTNFSRFHPINRHFLGKPPMGPKQIDKHRRPYRKSVTQNRIPRNDEITSRKSDNSIPESFPGEVPLNMLKMKHHYGSRRHHNQPRNNNDNVIKTKIVFDREKLKSLMRQHRQKKVDDETGFMKNIRKFLKHTFD